MKTSEYDIDTADYEAERHVFEMWRWLNGHLAGMRAADPSDGNYLERKGRNVKQLIEEAIPVAAFALRFVRPADEVFVRCLTGNQNYDATLSVRGFNTLDIKVEVTTAEPEDAPLRRQALSREGWAYGSGPIRRDEKDRRRILMEAEMSDVHEEQTGWVELALQAARRKVDSGRYDSKTAILVRLSPWFAWEMTYRAELERRTRNLIRGRRDVVYGVYYFSDQSNTIDGLRFRL